MNPLLTATDLVRWSEERRSQDGLPLLVRRLAERDPRLDLPAGERWMAAVHRRTPQHSEALRRGLAEGMALLATQPAAVRQLPDPAGAVRAIVHDIFGPRPDPARWYSLTSVLRPLGGSRAGRVPRRGGPAGGGRRGRPRRPV